MSNQRPCSTVEYHHTPASRKLTLNIDGEGVCDACRMAERKEATDWQARKAELVELCAKYRGFGTYDCIVPGSGGKDSFYAAHMLRTEFGMKPLLVTWAPHLYTDVGWRNLIRWQALGDHMLVTPRTLTHRILTRLALDNLFHPFQPFIVGQKMLAPSIAHRMGIPLVFYGESEQEYGDPLDRSHRQQALWREYSENVYLSGLPVTELPLTKGDLEMYLPSPASGVQVHYLGYYLRWHPQASYYHAVEHGGFEPSTERTPGTYSRYNSIDDKMDDLHYWTTWIKFGLGRASYDASQEIRNGDITREEGIALVHRYDGEWPFRFAGDVAEYLSPPGFSRIEDLKAYCFALAEKFRSPHLWDGDRLRHGVS
jgi:N-acetyl sugar amidotransferase